MIAILLLGALLSGLFNVFYQNLKKNISARELKQKVLQLELFEQRMKTLLAKEESIWIDKHPQAEGLTLLFHFDENADPDFAMCGPMQGMLFLNAKKELCLARWSQEGKDRAETLLDNVDQFKCSLFDTKKKAWISGPIKEGAGNTVMARIDLSWNKREFPFVFFLNSVDEMITYKEGI